MLGSLLRVYLFFSRKLSRRIDLNSNRKQSIYRLLLECQCRSGILILLTIGVFLSSLLFIFVASWWELTNWSPLWVHEKALWFIFIWLKMFIFLFDFLGLSCLFIFSVLISLIIAQIRPDPIRSDPTHSFKPYYAMTSRNLSTFCFAMRNVRRKSHRIENSFIESVCLLVFLFIWFQSVRI